MGRARSIPPPFPSRHRAGYTLIELISVSALTAVALSISVTAYYAWRRPTTSETAVTKLGAMLGRARSHALARQRTTRLLITPDDKGAFVVAERQIGREGGSWLPIATSNRLDRTSSSEGTVYFRPDGSCCLSYDEIDAPTSEAEAFPIDLENIPGRESRSRGRLRTILLDPRSGLFTIQERSYGDDGR